MTVQRVSVADRVRIAGPVLGTVNAAIAAVEGALLEPGNDLVLQNQLESALTRLREMLVDIQGRRRTSDSVWLGQMVADQWDPKWPVTDAVLRATQAFTSLNDTRGRKPVGVGGWHRAAFRRRER